MNNFGYWPPPVLAPQSSIVKLSICLKCRHRLMKVSQNHNDDLLKRKKKQTYMNLIFKPLPQMSAALWRTLSWRLVKIGTGALGQGQLFHWPDQYYSQRRRPGSELNRECQRFDQRMSFNGTNDFSQRGVKWRKLIIVLIPTGMCSDF